MGFQVQLREPRQAERRLGYRYARARLFLDEVAMRGLSIPGRAGSKRLYARLFHHRWEKARGRPCEEFRQGPHSPSRRIGTWRLSQ